MYVCVFLLEILFKSNPSVYVCETPSRDLNFDPCSPHPTNTCTYRVTITNSVPYYSL